MQKKSRHKLKSIELDMTPMIDVIFLLIVFFTLVINFTEADQNERVKLPVSELAQPPEQPPTEPITLHILTNGDVIYDGMDCSLPKLQEEVNYHLRVLTFLNVPIDKVTVIVRADAQCESRHFLDVIELCKELNLQKFVLRTRQLEE